MKCFGKDVKRENVRVHQAKGKVVRYKEKYLEWSKEVRKNQILKFSWPVPLNCHFQLCKKL